jgi:diguanylate cyclase (GGDEF)-like protein/PAS domain S-box-containing protein
LQDPFLRFVAVRDPQGVIRDFRYAAVNEAAVRDYQLPRAVLMSSTLLQLDPFTGDALLFDRFVHVVDSGIPLVLEDFEYPDAPPTGTTLYYDINASKSGDGLIVSYWDVTRRFQNDRRIAAEERQLRGVMDTLLDPLLVFAPVRDDDGRLIDFVIDRANPGVVQYLRTRKEDLEGARLRRLTPGEAVDVLFAWSRRVLLTGERLILDEIPIDIPGRGVRQFDIRAVKLGDAVSLTYRDVTERVDVMRQVAEAKEHYRLVAENASEMVFQTDVGGVIQWVSPSVEWVLGIPVADVVGSDFADLIHPEDLARAEAAQREALAEGGRRGRVEVRVRTASGEYRWMAVLGKALIDGDGRVVGGIDAVRDIEDARRAAAALQESEERFRHAMMDAAIGLAIVAPDGGFVRVNPALCQMLGRSEQQLLDCTWQELTHREDLDADQSLADEVRQGTRDNYRITKRYLRPDSTVVWADLSVSAVRDDTGRLLNFLSQIIDITESVHARRALATSEEHYRLLAENSLDVIFRASPQGRLLWISPSVTEVLGYQPEDVVGAPLFKYVWSQDLPQTPESQLRQGRVDFEARVRQADGTYRWVDVTSRAVLNGHGEVIGRVGRLRDIAGKREAEEALRRSEQRFRTAMESAPTGMAVVSLDREFVEVNPALCRLLGRPEPWLLSHSLGDVLDPVDDDLDVRLREQVLAGIVPSLTQDHQMIRSDGQRVLVEQSIGLLRDPNGHPSGFVSQFVDVTESRRARERLRFMATHDSLTELLNRRELVARATGILGQVPRTGENIGVLFADIDQLKPINDSHGHVVGDHVIVTVAQRIRDQVRATDIVARFGGDEFVLVLPSVHTTEDVVRIAEGLHGVVRAPIAMDGTTLSITLSIGAVMVAPGSEPDQAFRCADQALYRAKREGRDRTVVYDPRLDG